MDPKEGTQIFLRLLNEKQDILKNSIEQLLSALVGENSKIKKEKGIECFNNALLLKSNLPNQDVPPWLNFTINILDSYKLDRISDFDLLKKLVSEYSTINNYNWKFEEQKVNGFFDFDIIYEQCKKESKIDELFDEIISLLKKIIQNDDIITAKFKDDLERVIATITKHNNASYFALHGMKDFLELLLKNIIWEELEKFPGIGGIVKGLRTTIKETDVTFSELTNNIKQTWTNIFNSNIKISSPIGVNLIEQKD